ncbi:Tubulin polyglutamylase TTLL6 [Microtus ochrogaster]|uniref:Tubulin polyglutamylase TTLL6 n=1 Tax=Microtus ochrogaster TaxID=79684 RepID=A0A8J6FW49_MICOH|nr:Tubulin polyglutamylase TTLL6 [Microtus ochrogaster]
MLQCLTSESEEGGEEREESSSSTEDLEELKELVTLAFVRENTQKRLQNAQQHGKKKRKRKRAAQQYGLREAGDSEDWTLYWTDYSVSLERVMEMKSYQKINHFPGMSEICRKDLLARNMSRMLKLFPKDFHFFPRTWCLPAEMEEVKGFQAVRLQKTEEYEKKNCGGFRLIYPGVNLEKYEKFFQDNSSLFQNTVASRARELYARQLIQELRQKQEKKSFLKKEKKTEMPGESVGEQARDRILKTGQQRQQQKCKTAIHPPKQSYHPVALVSCTPGLFLNIRGIRKTETAGSLHQDSKEATLAPCKPMSARHYSSVPDLRSSNPTSSGTELRKCNSTIKEVKSADSVNVVSNGLPLTPVETSPEPTAQLSTSLESLASLSLTSSPECSSSESVQTVSWKGKQRRAPQKLVQEKKSKPPVSSKPRSLDVSLTLIKNEVRRQHLMSEILQKVQMKKRRSLFPAPKSQNLSLPKEWCSHSHSSGRKREMDVPSVLLLQGSHSHAKSLNDLLVVATQARLDPRPSRSHSVHISAQIAACACAPCLVVLRHGEQQLYEQARDKRHKTP